jgi:hypothetical protein
VRTAIELLKAFERSELAIARGVESRQVVGHSILFACLNCGALANKLHGVTGAPQEQMLVLPEPEDSGLASLMRKA